MVKLGKFSTCLDQRSSHPTQSLPGSDKLSAEISLQDAVPTQEQMKGWFKGPMKSVVNSYLAPSTGPRSRPSASLSASSVSGPVEQIGGFSMFHIRSIPEGSDSQNWLLHKIPWENPSHFPLKESWPTESESPRAGVWGAIVFNPL